MQNRFLICLPLFYIIFSFSCRSVSSSGRLQASGTQGQLRCIAPLSADRNGNSLFLRGDDSYLQLSGAIQSMHYLGEYTYRERGKEYVADFQMRTCKDPIEPWGQEGFIYSGSLDLYFHGVTDQFLEWIIFYRQNPNAQHPLSALVGNDQVFPTCLLQRANPNIEIIRTETGNDVRVFFERVFFPSELDPMRTSVGLRVPVGTAVGEGIVANGPGAMMTLCKNLLQINVGKQETFLPFIQN